MNEQHDKHFDLCIKHRMMWQTNGTHIYIHSHTQADTLTKSR